MTRRIRAGLYEGTLSGIDFQVEFMTTAYGDSGWFAWVGPERSDSPRPTRREALAVATRMIEALTARASAHCTNS